MNARGLLSDKNTAIDIKSQKSLIDEIYHVLCIEHKSDVITISETWLDSGISDDDLSLDGFQSPFRKDRNTHGGGVMTYIRSNIQVVRRLEFEIPSLELMRLQIKLNTHNIFS